jgi:hypothetical protein
MLYVWGEQLGRLALQWFLRTEVPVPQGALVLVGFDVDVHGTARHGTEAFRLKATHTTAVNLHRLKCLQEHPRPRPRPRPPYKVNCTHFVRNRRNRVCKELGAQQLPSYLACRQNKLLLL